MDPAPRVGFKQQQGAIAHNRAIQNDIIKPKLLMNRLQRLVMPFHKNSLESLHHPFFFRAFGGGQVHASGNIMNNPVIGDRQMADVGPAINQGDAELAIKAIPRSEIDEITDVKLSCVAALQINLQFPFAVYLRKPFPAVGVDRADDLWKYIHRKDIALHATGLRQNQLRDAFQFII